MLKAADIRVAVAQVAADQRNDRIIQGCGEYTPIREYITSILKKALATALMTVAMGAALGAVNGLLVWKVGIPSIVMALGTMRVYHGVIFLMRW